jgi:putative transcriptional regulator
MKLKKGQLLISEPFLNDSNFERSVILLCEHNEEGSFGFVLNKQTSHQVQDVLDEPIDYELFLGGPVDHSSMHYIHCRPDLITDAVLLKDDIYWGGNFEEVKAQIRLGLIPSEQIRFFLGYSGWDSGQLDLELNEEVWIIYDGDIQFIFQTDATSMWREVLKRMGGKYKAIANFPTDPRLN